MIDSHCHIYAEQFDEDRAEALKRAREQGVRAILLPNIDLESIQALKECAREDWIHPMMGLHPCSVQANYAEVLDKLKKELDTQHYVAVGEIGIDLFWDTSTKEWQIDAFRRQCAWALEKNLPIAIHSRESIDLILDLLEGEFKGINGVFHCFTGDRGQLDRVLDLGMYVGLGGVLTFKNTHLRELAVHMPMDRILLETDAPYLAPVPFRGKRNEPSYLGFVLKTLAETLAMAPHELDAQITDNTLRLFKI